ncbi:FMN-binding negative transcriptional regulator [Serratia quinivorans]|uniref:FMN-binding negative transcriptional regulator n=1 Tax=Serratia quinivorans TaxID=137545 RepID=UPI00217C358E|nr:FMN-binding negative transcriptional regulator [Serratia quinivorans]CAI0896485.1 Protease synthase and sporulation protein PAI 2 [Serratia quinivorans]CAI0923056.1 Protease synthase and sporulation protein PAI 2 [Serratia quinivorans]CAI0945031.1 Protease synthase and sporulation protein PAI 2 [Serratia quinivorans]CAI1534610.1 Protease synthase and sporulation protein PAI 2 [Serratia quinivorans]CAI2064006.1 Protease synthase and sporulation protein PAI 2 [Serratia quinivorans]
MYQPASFRDDRLESQIALVRAHPLGMLISHGEQGLVADPLPFLIDVDQQGNMVLRAHLSRANPHWSLLQTVQECLVVFQGREGYISPGWYETKRQTGKAVPTWNYSVVQLHGVPRVTEDVGWLRQQLDGLTALQEGRQPEPWHIDDAPANYIAAQIGGIVGIEIAVTHREGKWKMSQNRNPEDVEGVIAALRAGDVDQQQLADEVERRRG